MMVLSRSSRNNRAGRRRIGRSRDGRPPALHQPVSCGYTATTAITGNSILSSAAGHRALDAAEDVVEAGAGRVAHLASAPAAAATAFCCCFRLNGFSPAGLSPLRFGFDFRFCVCLCVSAAEDTANARPRQRASNAASAKPVHPGARRRVVVVVREGRIIAIFNATAHLHAHSSIPPFSLSLSPNTSNASGTSNSSDSTIRSRASHTLPRRRTLDATYTSTTEPIQSGAGRRSQSLRLRRRNVSRRRSRRRGHHLGGRHVARRRRRRRRAHLHAHSLAVAVQRAS